MLSLRLFNVLPSCFPNSGNFLGPKINRARINITVTSGKPTPKDIHNKCLFNSLFKLII